MVTNEPIHIISLGAGVQSSTMSLMAACGEITPMPTAAIFADTQAEPGSVYRWLDWLEKQLPFPVIRATAGNLTETSLKLRKSQKSGNTYLSPSLPVYIINKSGGKGMYPRQCTRNFKIDVVRKAARTVMDSHHCKSCVQWIGISIDEASRMKDSPNKRFVNIWPLIDRGISREGCLNWMQNHGYPTPPRSACVYCPYHNNHEWLNMRNSDPQSFALAVEYERKLSKAMESATAMNVDEAFLHASRISLDKVDFSDGTDDRQLNLFNNECEGMCGV